MTMADEYVRIDGKPYRMVDNRPVPLHPSIDIEALQAEAGRPEAPSHPTSTESEAAGTPLPDDLDDMTIAQLRDLAAERDIDISGLTRKDDIRQAIRDG